MTQFADPNTVWDTLARATDQTLDCENDNGSAYTLRFVGTEIAWNEDKGVGVYLIKNSANEPSVIVYTAGKGTWESDDPETELREWLDDDEYIDAMNALGIRPVIDL